MSFLHSLDEAIIKKVYEPFSNRLYALTGKNNYWFARMTLWAGLALSFGCALFLPSDDPWRMAIIISSLTGSIAALISIRSFEQKERAVEQSSRRVLNTERMFIPWGVVRLAMLTISSMQVVASLIPNEYIADWLGMDNTTLVSAFATLLQASAFYFAACTPPHRKFLRQVGFATVAAKS